MMRALVGLSLALAAAPAAAHPLAPSLLDIEVEADGRAAVRFKTPALRPAGVEIAPILPDACAQEAGAVREEGTGVVFKWSVDCGAAGWIGRSVGIRGLDESRTNGLLRVQLPDGHAVRTVLDGGRAQVEITAAPSAWDTARDYLRLGFEHILGGIDHLLFVAGLLLLVAGARMLVETVTAFTIGHSITLSLAALGFVNVPSGPIELTIALSIVWLAVEIALRRRGDTSNAWRRPRTIAGGFGLLHGFGFAGALAEIGLPQAEIPLALFSFNVGIELGQLCFVAVLALVALALRKLGGVRPAWGNLAAAYGIGSLAFYWALQRAVALL